MTRRCARPGCPHLTIEDGRECPEHTNETLRATRAPFLPEWRRRAMGLSTDRLRMKDMTGSAA